MLHITKIKPVFTSILLTADRYEEDVRKGKLITDSRQTKGNIKWYQTVLAVGSGVRDFAPGDKVMLESSHFAVRKYDKNSVQNDLDNNPIISYVVPTLTIEDEDGNPKEVLYVDQRSVQFVFEGEEREDVIIKPAKPTIIKA